MNGAKRSPSQSDWSIVIQKYFIHNLIVRGASEESKEGSEGGNHSKTNGFCPSFPNIGVRSFLTVNLRSTLGSDSKRIGGEGKTKSYSGSDCRETSSVELPESHRKLQDCNVYEVGILCWFRASKQHYDLIPLLVDHKGFTKGKAFEEAKTGTYLDVWEVWFFFGDSQLKYCTSCENRVSDNQ